jgi:WD40 repeat protein
VRLVDAETWELKDKLDLDGSVMALAFSPDGKRLALGGGSYLAENGSFVQLWDVEKKKRIGGTKEQQPEPKAAPELGQANKGHVTCLAFSPDGRVLAAGDRDAKIRLFDGQTGKAKAVLDDHSDPVDGIAFSPDGKTLVSGSEDKTVKLWNMPEGKLRRTLKGNKGSIMAIAVSPDGSLLATAGGVKEDDRSIVEVILWDAKTGELKQTLPDQTVPAYTLAFSPDGTTLAIGGGDGGELKDGGRTTGQLRLWRLDPPTGKRK